MEPQIIIARRIARELSPGMLVNLGIGIPTLVANHVPSGMQVFFQSENGLIGTGSIPEEGMAHPILLALSVGVISISQSSAVYRSIRSDN